MNSIRSDSDHLLITRGYLICIIATIFWSSTAIFIRHLTEAFQMPPLVLAFWRDLIVALTLFITLMVVRPALVKYEIKSISFFLLFGFILSIFNSLWTVSVALNGAGIATVLAYSSAAFTAIIGWRLFAESLDYKKIIAVCISLLGCVFVSGAYDLQAWRLNFWGIIAGLTSGMGFAGYSLMGRAASRRKINPWVSLLYSFFFASFFLFFYNLLPSLFPGVVYRPSIFWLDRNVAGWVTLIALAIGPTVLGYGLYTVSLVYLPASVANLIATLEPVMTAILAYALLGERFTPPQIIGSIFIVGGVVLLRISGDG